MKLNPHRLSSRPATPAGSAGAFVRLLPTRCHRLFAAFAAIGCCALLPHVQAVPSVKAVTPLYDTWVSSASGSHATDTTLTMTNAASGAKEIYLKFKVTIGGTNGIGTGTPTKAELVLKKTSGPTSAQILVSAANNRADSSSTDWIESMTWSGKPTVISPTIATGTTPADGATVTIDVTPYISGAGVFSICLKTWAGTDVNFASKEGTGGPVLNVTIDSDRNSAYYQRAVVDVVTRGDTYLTRYGSSTTTGTTDVGNYGFIDVTKQPYGARTSGVTTALDAELNTLAIQRALNEARDARVATYFPGGTYVVSDTLNAVEGIIDYSYYNGERWNQRDFGCVLLGATSGTRAKLSLRDTSSGFNSVSSPKPVLYVWSRNNKGTGNPDTNQENINFNQVVRDLDIEIQANNAGAVGISQASAQGSQIHDVTITGLSAFHAGLLGSTGPGGSINNVTVIGGTYGIYVAGGDGETTTVANCTFKNQTTNSIYWNGLSAMTVVGCWVEGKGMYFTSFGAWSGCLSVVDSVVQISPSTSPAFAGTRNLYLNNVYVANTSVVSQITGLTNVAGQATGWVHVKEYAAGVNVDQSPDWSQASHGGTDGASWVPSFVAANGSSAPTRYTTGSGTPPTQLLATTSPFTGRVPIESEVHAWHPLPALPSWEATTGTSGVVNAKMVTGHTVAGDNATDDYAALQYIITNNQKVFIPRGEYRISQPLVLRSDSVVFGINKNFSRFKPLAGATAYSNSASPNPLVDTQDDANATTLLAEVMLSQTMDRPGVYSLRWRTGGGSAVRDINYERRLATSGNVSMNFPLIKIEGNGGGRWFNLWTDNTSNQGANYRHLKVSGTTQPLTMYMFNPEDDAANIQVEFSSAKNINIYGVKAEGKTAVFDTLMQFTNCANFRLIGFGGNAQPSSGGAMLIVNNCQDFLFATQSFQQTAPSGDQPVDPWLYKIVRDVVSGAETPGYEQFVLYKRGSPSFFGPWVSEDVGNPALAGGTSFDNGVYSVDAAGADIFGTADEFRFVHQSWSGDAQLIARVGAIEVTHAWAKAGLMLRETTTGGSKNVMITLTASNGVQMHHRDTTSGASVSDQWNAGPAAPYYLRLERHGDTYTGWQSPDGEMWFLTAATTFTMDPDLQAGLAVTSHNTASVNTSTFNRVALATPPTYVATDIGSVTSGGSSTINYTTDELTVNGAGTAIGGTADSFRLSSIPWTGDATIVAEIVSVENTNASAKGVVTIRNTTNANAAHATIAMTADNHVQLIARAMDGGSTTTVASVAVTAGARFVKLVRTGSTFTASYMNDAGSAWVSLGSTSVTMSSTSPICAGVGSCSIINTTNYCTSVFSSVFVK